MRDGHASMTARRVAAQRLSFERVTTAYGRPDDDQRLQADVAAGLDVSPSGLTRYLQARTTFFDRVAVRWIDAGRDQVVVVGAGYDGRALRYASPDVRWFELDHPDTNADKLARVARLGLCTDGVTFAAVDFVDGDVGDALARAGHERARPTAFLCEGVAGYLPDDVLWSLLGALAACAAPGSLLAISLSLDPGSAAATEARARLAAAVAAMGEPLTSTIPRGELDDRLAGAGWTIRRATDPAGVDVRDSDRSAAFVLATV